MRGARIVWDRGLPRGRKLNALRASFWTRETAVADKHPLLAFGVEVGCYDAEGERVRIEA